MVQTANMLRNSEIIALGRKVATCAEEGFALLHRLGDRHLTAPAPSRTPRQIPITPAYPNALPPRGGPRGRGSDMPVQPRR
jgi:hypothetical protein